MNKQEQVQQMTTYMANFVSHIAKVLLVPLHGLINDQAR